MEIYAFGSITRGEIDSFSDVDLLILKDINEEILNINKDEFSIYTYKRLLELWDEGNPFAWHLFLESKCVFSSDKIPFIQTLPKPNKYMNCRNDLEKFYQLYIDSRESIITNNYSIDFDLSMIFLAIRNFASCFALGYMNKYIFSRDSAIKIEEYSLNIDNEVYESLKKARLLATRGIGKVTSEITLNKIMQELPQIENWFNNLLKKY